MLHRSTGEPLSQQTLRTWLSTAQKRAGLPVTGALHIVRHTFCSHLAMRNAPALAIQQLTGHTSSRTTLRYMHLGRPRRTGRFVSSMKVEELLLFGDILETRQRHFQKHRCRKELTSVPDGIRKVGVGAKNLTETRPYLAPA